MKRFSVSISDELAAEMERVRRQRLDRPSFNQLVRESLVAHLTTSITKAAKPASNNGGNSQPAPCPEAQE